VTDPVEDEIVASIRRIVRAVDLHSRRLVEQYGLTAPQLATLRAVVREGPLPIGSLARVVHLSQPTVSGILDRLERQQLVRRQRSETDRRSVSVSPTAEGERVLREAPSLLQDTFRRKLADLEAWERTALLSALQRVAAMMDAEGIDAAPLLESGPISRPTAPGAAEDPGEAGAAGAGRRRG